MAKKEDNNLKANANYNLLNSQKYLYDTGLQNIFDDYQKQVASLDAQKQTDVENAYYVRELSKKYLGEYGSNAGIGDVSGQVLDIYGKYQQNLNEINKNYNTLLSNYESQYKNKEQQYKVGLAQTKAQITAMEQQEQMQKQEQERLDKISEIQYNLTTGILPNGVNVEGYLNANREVLGNLKYWELMGQNKLVSMNKVANETLLKTNEYENQTKWNEYIDTLISDSKINQQQAEYLKSMYSVEQSTNFELDFEKKINPYNIEMPKSIKNSIGDNAKVYTSRDKKSILVETKNEVKPEDGIYSNLEEVGSEVPMDVPFTFGGKFFIKSIKNNNVVYTEFASLPYKEKKGKELLDWSMVRPSAS